MCAISAILTIDVYCHHFHHLLFMLLAPWLLLLFTVATYCCHDYCIVIINAIVTVMAVIISIPWCWLRSVKRSVIEKVTTTIARTVTVAFKATATIAVLRPLYMIGHGGEDYSQVLAIRSAEAE